MKVFTCHIYASDAPQPLDEHNISPHLQKAWDKVYDQFGRSNIQLSKHHAQHIQPPSHLPPLLALLSVAIISIPILPPLVIPHHTSLFTS